MLSELSEASGLTPEEIAQVEIATDTPESLQRETADGLTLEGMLGTDAPEEGMVERIALRESIDQLPEKEPDDHSSPLLQGTDPGTDCPDPGGVSGAGIPAGAPGPETVAGVPLALKCASPWNSVMVPQYRLGMWVMRQRGFSRSRMAMVS